MSGNNPDNFPSDSTQWNDTDGDGYGDNPLGTNPDNCPLEYGNSTFPGLGCLDSDGDGHANTFDAFPYDANETHDTDSDGVGDNADEFPLNALEQFDFDGDGIGDNADAFPEDANESIDSDGDGVGDNSDVFPNDANESEDSDGDGIGDNSDEYPLVDNFLDTDEDGILDLDDAFPKMQPKPMIQMVMVTVITNQEIMQTHSLILPHNGLIRMATDMETIGVILHGMIPDYSSGLDNT